MKSGDRKMLKRVDRQEIEYYKNYLFRYQGNPYTGLVYSINEAGLVIAEDGYCEGIEWGLSRQWYSNGQLKKDYKCRHGCSYGWGWEWYVTGQLKNEFFISNESGVLIKKKQWNVRGVLTEYFDLENDPQLNPEEYEDWISYEEARKNTLSTMSKREALIMSKGLEFEKEIAKYLVKYPSDRVYYQLDFSDDFLER
jgi:antitoxin component YwqK of YwqJK toxin-antitoxin module